MYKKLISEELKKVASQLKLKTSDTVLYISENPKFGDYSSNLALQQPNQEGKKPKHSPKEIASQILDHFGHPLYLERIEIAGPGFLNFYIKDLNLLKVLDEKLSPQKSDKKVLVEFADPNTHKAFHIGHLRTLAIGESLSRFLEFKGVEVFRVNYGSDIGLTVAKSLWGVKKLGKEYEKAKTGSLKEKAEFLGQAYTDGHKAYVSDEGVKKEIDELTNKIYARDPEVMGLWEETKQWSLSYFETLYSMAGVEFDVRVNESEVDQPGKKIVLENIGKVFVEDQGAVIFQGEKYGLHTRVFITSTGNPTYEAKEVGLITKYQELFPADQYIILSDVQQGSFFEVVNKAIELIYPHLEGKKKHFSYGFVTLTTGKMSSREGNVITAEALIDQVKQAIFETHGKADLEKDQARLIKIALP